MSTPTGLPQAVTKQRPPELELCHSAFGGQDGYVQLFSRDSVAGRSKFLIRNPITLGAPETPQQWSAFVEEACRFCDVLEQARPLLVDESVLAFLKRMYAPVAVGWGHLLEEIGQRFQRDISADQPRAFHGKLWPTFHCAAAKLVMDRLQPALDCFRDAQHESVFRGIPRTVWERDAVDRFGEMKPIAFDELPALLRHEWDQHIDRERLQQLQAETLVKQYRAIERQLSPEGPGSVIHLGRRGIFLNAPVQPAIPPTVDEKPTGFNLVVWRKALEGLRRQFEILSETPAESVVMHYPRLSFELPKDWVRNPFDFEGSECSGRWVSYQALTEYRKSRWKSQMPLPEQDWYRNVIFTGQGSNGGRLQFLTKQASGMMQTLARHLKFDHWLFCLTPSPFHYSTDCSRWVATVYELAWREMESSPLRARRLAWSPVHPEIRLPLASGKNWNKPLVEQCLPVSVFKDAAELADRCGWWFSQLDDFAMASTHAIDLILARLDEVTPVSPTLVNPTRVGAKDAEAIFEASAPADATLREEGLTQPTADPAQVKKRRKRCRYHAEARYPIPDHVTANVWMQECLQKHPETKEWSIDEWQSGIGVSKAAISETSMWKSLRAVRGGLMFDAERRSRRPNKRVL